MSARPTSDDDIHPLARPFLWLDKPWARQMWFYIFLVGALGLLAYEALVPGAVYAKYNEVFGFYEIEGFFGFCIAVLSGWPLRWLLARPADYYDTEEDRAFAALKAEENSDD